MKVLYFETVDSTQDVVMKMVEDCAYEEGTFVVAQMQTKGRGRSGTSWTGTIGCLTFSYATNKEQKILGILTNIKHVLDIFGVDVCIKWPNDITISNKKIGGVIIEQFGSLNVVGIGINLCGYLQYPTIQSISGVDIGRDAFILAYNKVYQMVPKVNLVMPDVWFGGEIFRVKEVLDEHLILCSGDGREIKISAHDYSYLNHINRIVRKCN